MTLLVISPDYASHLLPLATLATAWHSRGERVVVATGPATDSIVTEFGFERVDLRLGRGSNPGVIRAEDQPTGEDDSLRGFFDATREGMIPTLRYQAAARSVDLLWSPVEAARNVDRILDAVQPDAILVDHLAFSARLALTARGVAHGDVVLGHPSALPVGDESYGMPAAWPRAFSPASEELADLRALCESVARVFTEQWNDALAQIAPGSRPSTDAFREHGDHVLYNYPAGLHPAERTALLPRHTFLGSAIRSEPVDAEVEAWLSDSDLPLVYVSFGSFLSARGDVLARVVEALRPLPVRVALAHGSTDARELGPVPSTWLVREYLPQVRLLSQAVLGVSHGGNNSVTEAATAGVPLVVLPFSTDQFAGAAAIEDAGLGECLDPNSATADELRAAIERVLGGGAPAAAAKLGERLRAEPGPESARRALL